MAVALREAAGDRNVDTFTGGDELSSLAVVLRVAAKDRNVLSKAVQRTSDCWRSPFGAAEDRNNIAEPPAGLIDLLAVTLQGKEDCNIYNTYKLGHFGLERPLSGAAENHNN
ncbi:hypothetical protein GCM10010304_83100 [Streptomyces roseoviolaceus]